MRSTYRALIVIAVLAAAGRASAQEPGTPVELSPTPVAAQAAPDASQSASALPSDTIAPAPLAPLPADATTAPVAEAAPPGPATIAPQQQPASVAPAAPSKNAKARKPRETTAKQPRTSEPAPETSAAGAAAATTEVGQTPPSSGAGPDASEAAVPPAPVADQRPVVEPVAVEQRAPRTGSTVLLVGGLLLGLGAIGAMLARRRRNDSISIVDHEVPLASTRPPLASRPRTRTTESLS